MRILMSDKNLIVFKTNINAPLDYFGYSDGSNSNRDHDDWTAIKELMAEGAWRGMPP